jgi:cytochrome P450 PksS
MVFLLLIAGHETTVNLIGSGTLALLLHQDQLERLRSDPALLQGAVEELVRFTAPVETSTQRYASEDVELAGTLIPRGERVMVVVASANRDDRQFDGADQLDVAHELRPHLGFGHGIHYCLGAPLARIEGQIAIGTLLRRIPKLQLAVTPAELRWRPGLLIRGLVELPVKLS